MEQRQVQVAVPVGELRPAKRAGGRREFVVAAVIAVLVLGAGMAWVRSQSAGATSPAAATLAVGQPAPDFEVPMLDGTTFKLSDHRGQAVWINFWASWCPPCRAEMPDIDKVWKDSQGTDVMIVGVNYGENAVTARQFVDKLGVAFPIALDRDGKVGAAYRLRGFPSHFFVDKDGVLREAWIGPMNETKMLEKVEHLRSGS